MEKENLNVSRLTKIGLSIVVISAILYFTIVFLAPNFGLYQTYIVFIIAMMTGLFIVIFDTISIQRYEKNKNFKSRLKVFGIIFAIITVVFIAETIIFAEHSGDAGFYLFFGSIAICFLFYIPLIIIGFVFFLIFLRSPYAKYLDGKGMKVFYVLFAIIIMLLPLIFGFGPISETITQRGSVIHLSLSADGSILISVADYEYFTPDEKKVDFQIWDTNSGEVIWSEYPSDKHFAYISPDGKYYYTGYTTYDGIYNVSDGSKIINITTYTSYWSTNGKIFINSGSDPNKINIWNTDDFTLDRTTYWEGFEYNSVFSPDGSQTLIFTYGTTSDLISLIDISSDNITYVWNETFENDGINVQSLQWSKNNKIGFFYKNISDSKYHLILLDSTNGSKIYDKPVSHSYQMLISSNCEKYLTYNLSDNTIKIFNLSNLEKTINLDEQYERPLRSFEWSYNGNVIAIGEYDGKITIINASTGKIVSILETPLRDVPRPTPGFELIIFICSIATILFLKRNKKRLG